MNIKTPPEQQAVEELRMAMTKLMSSASAMVMAGRADAAREVAEITRRLKGIQGKLEGDKQQSISPR